MKCTTGGADRDNVDLARRAPTVLPVLVARTTLTAMRDVVVEYTIARHREWSTRRESQFRGNDRHFKGGHCLEWDRAPIHLKSPSHCQPMFDVTYGHPHLLYAPVEIPLKVRLDHIRSETRQA